MYNNLRAEMARRSMRQQDLADHLGIAKESVRNKLGGRCDWKLREMRDIQAMFGGTLDYLFVEEDGDGVQVGQRPGEADEL